MTEKIKRYGEALRRQVVQEYEVWGRIGGLAAEIWDRGDKYYSTMGKEIRKRSLSPARGSTESRQQKKPTR